MSKLQEEIREVKRQQGGDILKLKDKETVVVKLDLDANGDGTVSGITLSGSNSIVYNNLIGDLSAAASTGSNAITGIQITSGSAHRW
jgi:hypothetical protein